VAHGIDLAEVIKQGGDGGQLAADGTGGQAPPLEVFAPGNEVGAGDLAHLLGPFNTGKRGEVPDVEAVSAPGARVIEVGKPLQLGRHVAQALKLGPAQALAFRF
jgi:hypothetical protein